MPAGFWARIEANYRSAQALQRADDALEAHVEVLDHFPIREMERRGYLVEGGTRVAKLRRLLRFFGVANVEALNAVVLQPKALRASRAFTPSDGALAAWLRQAELDAAEIATKPYDEVKCFEALQQLRALTRREGVSWLEPMKQICAEVGIAVVVLKELPGCRINGATRWLVPGRRAMVALSLRHRRHDILWFTFFHELGHLLRHSKRETFVDAIGAGVAEDLERDADRFASRLLIPPEYEGELPALTSAERITEFAERIGVGASIVGRLHHENLAPPNRYQNLIPKYQFADE